MKIGFLCALKLEALTLKNLPKKILGKHEYQVVVSGIGLDNSKEAASKLVEANCDLIISWGFAGGMSPSLKTGDLIISTSQLNQTQKYASTMKSSNLLIKAFDKYDPKIGAVYSSNDVIDSPHRKKELYVRHGTLAADMESISIAKVASENNISFSNIRVILDDSTTQLPQFVLNTSENQGKIHTRKLAINIVKQPYQLYNFFKISTLFFKSWKNLARAARALC